MKKLEPTKGLIRIRDNDLISILVGVGFIFVGSVFLYFFLFKLQPQGDARTFIAVGVFAVFILMGAVSLLAGIRFILGAAGAVVNCKLQTIVSWQRTMLLTKRIKEFTFDEFETVSISPKTRRSRYGDVNGYSVGFMGKTSAVEIDYFDDKESAIRLAERLSDASQLSVVQKC